MKTLAFNVTHRKISTNTLAHGDGQEGAQRRDDNGFGFFRAAIPLFTTPRQERPPPLQVLQEQLLLLQEQLLLQALVPLPPPSPRPQLLASPLLRLPLQVPPLLAQPLDVSWGFPRTLQAHRPHWPRQKRHSPRNTSPR